MSEKTPKPSTPTRHRVARPDELTKETFEFIASIDEYKRTHMISIVTLEQVIEILGELDYKRDSGKLSKLEDLQTAVETYKKEKSRLFPNWSEIFEIAVKLGYERHDRVA